ncbi:MAG: hypothetical protein Q9166_000107 [cf. Caloplaca sp. 2 TL-2023]
MSRAAPYNLYQRSSVGYNRSFLPDPEKELIRQRREANQTVRLQREEYQLGMIIRAPLHEQDSSNARRPAGGSSIVTQSSEATLAENCKTESKFGTIFTKKRKMIVVALHQDHYVAIPLYTHNGRGLVNKKQPEEFVSVRDHRFLNDPSWEQLSTRDPLITETIKDGIDQFDPKSTAHLAYPVSRRYQLPVVHEGQLKRTSLKKLKDMYKEYARDLNG